MTKPVCHFDTVTFLNVRNPNLVLQGSYAIVQGVFDHPTIGGNPPFIRTSYIIRKWANQHGSGFETLNTIYKKRKTGV